MTGVEALAGRILAAGDAARPIGLLSEAPERLSLGEAYRVAAEIARLRVARGEAIVGWKIGFTNRTIWDEYGVRAPIWAPVYHSTLIAIDGPQDPVAAPLAGLVEPRIEPEIVLRFARSPRSEMDENALLGCIDGVAHGFEIVQSVFPGWRFAAPDTVAAFGLHGRLYCGPFAPVASRDRPRWRAALGTFRVTLDRDGRRVDEGTAANVLDGPLSACLHFLRGLAADGAYPRGVEPGDLVTTGTVTRAFPVTTGETWTSQVIGLDLPGLTLAFR